MLGWMESGQGRGAGGEGWEQPPCARPAARLGLAWETALVSTWVLRGVLVTGQQGCSSPQSPAALQGEGRWSPAPGTWPSAGLAGGDKAVHWGFGVHGDVALNPHVSCPRWSSFVRYLAVPRRLREIGKPPASRCRGSDSALHLPDTESFPAVKEFPKRRGLAWVLQQLCHRR